MHRPNYSYFSPLVLTGFSHISLGYHSVKETQTIIVKEDKDFLLVRRFCQRLVGYEIDGRNWCICTRITKQKMG